MRVRIMLLFWVLSIRVLGQVAPEAIEFKPAYLPGEHLTYRFAFGFFDAAVADVAVHTSSTPNQWDLVVHGETIRGFRWVFEVDDLYRSTIDAASGWPIEFERDINEGGYELWQHYQFQWEDLSVKTATARGNSPPTHQEHELPRRGHDMVSGLFALRQIPWHEKHPGDTVRIGLFMDEEWFDLELVHEGYQRIEAAGQMWNCIALQPVVQTGRIWKQSDDLRVYVSNDGRHIPVLAETRILFGKIRMELAHASGLRNPSLAIE